jgi:enediyne polyketide synthase
MIEPIAIVGMACEYPEARTPAELWANVLAQRRAFRRLPPERLRAEDYHSPQRDAPDCTYAVEAALIEGYEFDRVGFRVAGSTFRAADLTHWLALDVAARALSDAGFGRGDGLPRDAAGVFIGNTLTGEFSRAEVLRLRWPYVRRVLEGALRGRAGWNPAQTREFLDGLEAQYKAPFPPVGEETLAGGLSNTIAGRICNHFDLKGGGYTVDGACASSLLAIAHACTALAAGDLDVALAGGVDLSIDPFELVGFAKAGALAPEEMRVYDVRSAGFWPGEGCGMVVLMRQSDALARGLRTEVLIRGWGVSSDGQGGLTRPEVEGQLLALRRAYRRAGLGIETVAYFEGHGTGTSVGDATELRALTRARREAAAAAGTGLTAAAIGSIKANIGHTKAAAGVAGVIKTAIAVLNQVLPPTTGCEAPHSELAGAPGQPGPALRVLRDGEPWPARSPLRAGVSAMGFGGINAHLVLEGTAAARRGALGPRERALAASAQDAELFLLSAGDAGALRERVDTLRGMARGMARSELADLAAALAASLVPGPVRAALVAARPAALADGLEALSGWLATGIGRRLDVHGGLFLDSGARAEPPRIGFLFPGQGVSLDRDGGALCRRFEHARAVWGEAPVPPAADGDLRRTDISQPAIVAASLAALRVLEALTIEGSVAIGHSLGELTALGWAGALDATALLRIAAARGKVMAGLPGGGAMASVAAPRHVVEPLLAGDPVVIAGLNAPRQTVVSGPADAVSRVAARARQRGLDTALLPVGCAFHSPLVAAAVPAFAAALDREQWHPLRRIVFSTTSGARLKSEEARDLRGLLCRQVTAPVRFTEALAAVAEAMPVDLWIEVGPGRVLSGLVAQQEAAHPPAVALDAGGTSLAGLLTGVGAAFTLGAPVAARVLFEGRFTRPFEAERRPRFFTNPCERAPLPEAERECTEPSCLVLGNGNHADVARSAAQGLSTATASVSPSAPRGSAVPALDLIRGLVARRSELPVAAVENGHHLLTDLHLNSISVGQLVSEACRQLGLLPPLAPTQFADATVAELAATLGGLESGAARSAAAIAPAGVDGWVRAFTVALVERPRGPAQRRPTTFPWRVLAPARHPLARALADVFAVAHRNGDSLGCGVVVCLPPDPTEEHVGLLLDGARRVLAARSGSLGVKAGTGVFVLVQHGGGAASFARSLHLEAPSITTCVVDIPPDHPEAAALVAAEAAAASGYTEVHYDRSGRRSEPVLRLLATEEAARNPVLGPADVLLVTGGGKGIAAECALDLARESGCRLVILGRSLRSADAALAANLERFAAAGIGFHYETADVTDAAAVRTAVAAGESAVGPITALLHAAGVNVPQGLARLDDTAVLRTLAPKVAGLRHVLDAVDGTRLRLLVTFGSIIARSGMRGEADYALANEWLIRATERFAAAHPACRCLAMEWSVWSGIGMGERLGSIESLVREGISPIPVDLGMAALRDMVTRSLATTAVVVTSRFGDVPTLRPEPREVPFLRFLERTRVHIPGVELVVDADLTSESDPYLDDHIPWGEPLFPAVMGLEAMAQAARALMPSTDGGPIAFEAVRFDRPVALPHAGHTRVRLAALVRAPGRVEVVLRCEATGFQVDHFRALCCVGPSVSAAPEPPAAASNGTHAASTAAVALDPGLDLYGKILFHRGRFRRLLGYRRLTARECLALVEPGRGECDGWFGRYLPPALVLGDPAARDAFIHAVQACIPHRTLLPVGVERLDLEPAEADENGPWLVHAVERSRRDDTFTYDLEVTTASGRLRERWRGLRLRAVEGARFHGPWPVPLLGTFLERRVQELIAGSAVAVVVRRDGDSGGDRRARTDRVLKELLGERCDVRRRPDGCPGIIGGDDRVVSAAHTGDLTLAVCGRGPLGADIEPVVARSEALWSDLLGPERLGLALLIARESGEDLNWSATRIWAAGECLTKAGASLQTPLILDSGYAAASRRSPAGDRWICLTAGGLTVATCVVAVVDQADPLALAVAARSDHAQL